jgi:hypothetical protein
MLLEYRATKKFSTMITLSDASVDGNMNRDNVSLPLNLLEKYDTIVELCTQTSILKRLKNS